MVTSLLTPTTISMTLPRHTSTSMTPLRNHQHVSKACVTLGATVYSSQLMISLNFQHQQPLDFWSHQQMLHKQHKKQFTWHTTVIDISANVSFPCSVQVQELWCNVLQKGRRRGRTFAGGLALPVTSWKLEITIKLMPGDCLRLRSTVLPYLASTLDITVWLLTVDAYLSLLVAMHCNPVHGRNFMAVKLPSWVNYPTVYWERLYICISMQVVYIGWYYHFNLWVQGHKLLMQMTDMAVKKSDEIKEYKMK